VDEELVSIRCMQLPLVGMQLLLPNSAVAEIIGFDRSTLIGSQSGPVLGRISWRGVTVPVASIEELCGESMLEPATRSRIAIVYNPEGGAEMPYMGILMQDIPKAYLAENLRLSGKGEPVDCEFLSFRIEEMVDDYLVPDLDAIFTAVRPFS
jgi:chemosensory pili system protein ChpC